MLNNQVSKLDETILFSDSDENETTLLTEKKRAYGAMPYRAGVCTYVVAGHAQRWRPDADSPPPT
jgi:hypothetical protein